jgi:transcriptional regulator with GAF, ATPase, and Fis domain
MINLHASGELVINAVTKAIVPRQTPVPRICPRTASAADLQNMERSLSEHALQNARCHTAKAATARGPTRQQCFVRMKKSGCE